MDLHKESTFNAGPAAVYAALVDREFLVYRATRAQALHHEVRVDAVGAGHRTQTVQRFPAEVPAVLRKFVGETLDLDETITWGAAEPDGRRRGTVTLSVSRVPVRMDGTITLVPEAGGRTTRQVVDAQLKAAVPLVGRRIEEAAAPSVLGAVEGQARVAAEWLEGKR